MSIVLTFNYDINLICRDNQTDKIKKGLGYYRFKEVESVLPKSSEDDSEGKPNLIRKEGLLPSDWKSRITETLRKEFDNEKYIECEVTIFNVHKIDNDLIFDDEIKFYPYNYYPYDFRIIED